VKSRKLPFIFTHLNPSLWLAACYLVLFYPLFLLPNVILGQGFSDHNALKQKAHHFKNKVEYDSAIFYFQKLDMALTGYKDKKAIILNKLDIYDVYILQRDFKHALYGLNIAASDIQANFQGDPDLEAEFFQVKGSYFFATEEKDSAKYYLKRSIHTRISNFGPQDTLLHYAFNKLGNLYLAKSQFDSAYFYHQKALDLSLKKINPINFLSASSYQNLGIAAHRIGDYLQAGDYYTRSLELKEQLLGLNDPGLAKIYGNLGKFFSDLSKYNLALEYYEKAEQLLISRFDRDNIQFAYVYWNKGNVYTHNGDYIKATSYLVKAHSILENSFGEYNQDVLKILVDLGFAYDRKGETELAIEFYNKAAKNKNDAGIIKIYRNLGNIYLEENERDSAEKYYQLAILFAKNIYSGASYDLALCYQYYGEFLAKSGKSDLSFWYYSQAAEIFIHLFGNKNKDLSKVYRLQSEYFLKKSEFDSALKIIQAALVALLPTFSEFDPFINPTLKDIILDIYLLDALRLKATAFYLRFFQSKNFKDLYISLDIIDLTIDLTEEIRKTYFDEESQLILNNEARTVIDMGVIISYRLFNEIGNLKYLTKAFNYSEKGQSIILLTALRGLEAQTNTVIPNSKINFESKLTESLATCYNLLYQERQKSNPDEKKIMLWSDEIFKLRLSHDSILTSYRKNYPEYFRLKFDFTTISADSALRCLPEDQAILEYYIADSVVIGFLLADKKLTAQILGKSKVLTGKIDSLRQNFERNDYFDADQAEFERITSISADLYDILIRPFEGAIKGKRLIIIPDGELGYLSFDLLIKDRPDDYSNSYQNLNWLIRSNPISYSSSATIYFEQTNKISTSTKANLLAFAPSYDFNRKNRNLEGIDSVRLNLSPMTGTKEEVNAISGLFRTKKLFDNKATETYFKENAGNYGILHLAMHTIIDNKNPLYSKLVFTPSEEGSPDDGFLNTYELFNLKLPGQLAVLSACNTGSGKLERGEGIISLARGFFYAGIPSVVMTLWEIEDHSSADLMALFYENLKLGIPNDVALQQAKVTYLENAGKLHSHPYFWAGYVSIGKTDPISFEPAWNTLSYIFLSTGILILIILIYLFINRRVYFHKKRY
jgi:CHAT domain-containing protein/tetratricopeptide (TPR) repeat protein